MKVELYFFELAKDNSKPKFNHQELNREKLSLSKNM